LLFLRERGVRLLPRGPAQNAEKGAFTKQRIRTSLDNAGQMPEDTSEKRETGKEKIPRRHGRDLKLMKKVFLEKGELGKGLTEKETRVV